MRGLFHDKARRTAGTVMAAVSAFLISSCAPQRTNAPVNPKPPAAQKNVPAAHALKAKMPALSSVWEGGHCSYKDNSVSYYSHASGQTKTLKLDVEAKGSVQLICSGSFTVLVGKSVIYVAIGGADLLEGREWFGALGDRFTWANSYEMDLPDGLGRGPRSASILGDKLCVMGTKGNNWSIELGDPFKGWKAY